MILLGAVLAVGMAVLWIQATFSIVSVLYIVFGAASILPIWAGVVCLRQTRYPVVLLVDDNGIHYFDYASRWGYDKREVTIPWKEVKNITAFDNGDDINEGFIGLHVEFENEYNKPVIIDLHDTIVSEETVSDVVSKIDGMRKFYAI